MRDPRPTDGAAPTPLEVGRVVALLVVVGVALRLAGWHLHALVVPWSDLRSYFLPKYQYAADRIAAGELPLWNPLEFTGIPFLATVQPGVFYPPTRIVYALLAGERAYDALFVLHVVLAAVATLWLARRLGLGPWASTFAALWVMEPTWLIRIYDHPVLVFGVTWIPVLVLLARRAVRWPTARAAAALGAVAAVQLSSGYPPYALATAYVLALGVPVWLLEARAGGLRLGRAAAAVGGAVALAALLAAAQLLPMLELLSASDRGAEASAMQAGLTHLAPSIIWLMNLPQMTLGASLSELWARYGPVLLGLAVVAPVLRARRGVTWFALGVAILCAVLPSRCYEVLPLYALVRFGAEWRFTAPLTVYLLAAVGLDALLDRLHASPRAAAVVTVAALAAATGWNWRQVPAPWLVRAHFGAAPLPAWFDAACPLDPARDRAYWLGGQSSGGLFQARIPSVGGFEQSLLPRRAAVMAGRLGVGNGGTIGEWAAHLVAASGLASRAGLRCVLAGPSPALRGSAFSPAHEQDGLVLYTNERAEPRARLVYEAVAADSPDAALALVERAPPEAVVLEGDDLPRLPPCAHAADGTVTLHSVRPEDLRLEVASACPAYLVLADTWAPGWTATVDGEPAAIGRADYAFRAVVVPAGRHEVRFRYAPRSVGTGLALSLLGALACAVLAGLRAPKRRTSQGT
jgi:hypothetical protein